MTRTRLTARGVDHIDPASVALVLAAVGASNLVFFAISRRLS